MDERLFRIYRPFSGEGDLLGKTSVFLIDRPGSLAELASIFSKYSINIIFFYYNRSEHPNRVLLEVSGKTPDAFHIVRDELMNLNLLDSEVSTEDFELGVLDTSNILKIEVQLENRPGTLGHFAQVLAKHQANVIFMSYNEDISETSAQVSLVTQDPGIIDLILKDLNEQGYYYSTLYKGAGHKEIEDVIGLNLAERFFFQLKKLLKTDDVEKLKKLVHSSKQLSDSLIKFSNEAGKHFEEGGIITKVLAFASASLMKTGDRFSYRKLPPVSCDDVTLHVFRLPTGGNLSLLESRDDCVMIDSGYGLYYDDVKKMLAEHGLSQSKIRRIYLTHADTDHAGLSGYFAKDFGCSVFMHEASRGVIEHNNRAWGADTPFLRLNHFFTILVNDFTKNLFPEMWSEFNRVEIGRVNGFRVIDSFTISGHTYMVVESFGGHIPGQVFFFSYDSGIIFTADYLLLLESLGPEEKEILNYPKFMMQSTNVNSQVFRQEMDMLKNFISMLDDSLRDKGKQALVVPGHGDYYPFSRLKS